MQYVGVVLTRAENPGQVADCIRLGGYNTLKVVTDFGLPVSWTDDTRGAVARTVDNLLIRTVFGDPSYRLQPGADPLLNPYALPEPDKIVAELAAWLDHPDVRRRKWVGVEIGNEWNITPRTPDDFIWNWRWHLEASIAAIRQRWPRETFPHLKLIAPGLILGPPRTKDVPAPDHATERCFALCADVMSTCDIIGLHTYEFFTFGWTKQARTLQLPRAFQLARQYFPTHPWFLTEFGINDPATPVVTKGIRYAAMMRNPTLPPQLIGATYYHLAINSAIQPEYHIYPAGDQACRGTR